MYTIKNKEGGEVAKGLNEEGVINFFSLMGASSPEGVAALSIAQAKRHFFFPNYFYFIELDEE